MPRLGVVAAGHEATAAAARDILEAGGNAFDAVVAANLAACTAEPVLSSLGGGGFLLARVARDGSERLVDFFAHTPRHPRPAAELDFQPIIADFGTTTQEFHIGLGSMATPGMVRGMFHIQRTLGRLPMTEVAAPAVRLAREGVVINALHAYIFRVVGPIYRARPETLRHYASPGNPGRLVVEGDLFRLPELADTLDSLAREGEDLFYRGEIAAAVHDACAGGGGAVGREDLAAYQVVERRPLEVRYRGARILTNPPPSWGGTLITLALELLAAREGPQARPSGSPQGMLDLAEVMGLANEARLASGDLTTGHLVQTWREGTMSRRGTTQISIADRYGNLASMTVSNGEGCGHLIPGTGIMPNNMLGEQDLNPAGFQRWVPDRRLASMMSPAIVQLGNRRLVATGSGGSNRIRSAVLQVLRNLIDHAMDVAAAVDHPRIHFEDGLLSLEAGFPPETVAALTRRYPDHHLWPERNLFFGGAHTVGIAANGAMEGAGDPRRGGVCVTA